MPSEAIPQTFQKDAPEGVQRARVDHPLKPSGIFMKEYFHPKATAEGVQGARVDHPLKPLGISKIRKKDVL